MMNPPDVKVAPAGTVENLPSEQGLKPREPPENMLGHISPSRIFHQNKD